MAKEKSGEQAISAVADTTPADTTPAAPAWWLCRINDSAPREFAVLAVDEPEAVEKFKRGASIRATVHKIYAWKLPEDFKPTEQDLALEKRLSAAD